MKMHCWFKHCALAMVIAVYGGGAVAVEPAPSAGDNPAAVDSPAPKPKKQKKHRAEPAPSINGLAQAAANAGVIDCVGRIQQVTNFLTANSKSGAFLFLAPSDANRYLVSTSLEIQAGNASTYASASFAPVGSDGCGALYESVAYWGNRCEEVANKAFASFTGSGKLGSDISMLDGGPSVRVFLMPAGQGCLSIKKEVIY